MGVCKNMLFSFDPWSPTILLLMCFHLRIGVDFFPLNLQYSDNKEASEYKYIKNTQMYNHVLNNACKTRMHIAWL